MRVLTERGKEGGIEKHKGRGWGRVTESYTHAYKLLHKYMHTHIHTQHTQTDYTHIPPLSHVHAHSSRSHTNPNIELFHRLEASGPWPWRCGL